MNNFAKFSILMAIAMLFGCRGQKAIEESVYVASDSCKVETSLNVQSLTNMVITESADSSFLQNHFDFEDGAGIIQIHPDGEVTIKGLKSASLIRQSRHKTADIQLSVSDSISAESHSEFSSATGKEIKTRKDTPTSKSNWLKYLLLVISILIGILFSLKNSIKSN